MNSPTNPPTILLVEDDELIATATAETLEAAGYRVVSLPDGQAACDALPRIEPDLILSDVRMPRCNGFELLQRVRSNPAHALTPFVIVSASADTADQRMGMSLGADDYVTKPYQPNDLLKTIKVRLERATMVGNVLQQHQAFLTRVLPHELRTPLSGIIGYADLMIEQGQAGEVLSATDLIDYGQNIRRSSGRLLKIAENFSLWSWFEAQAAAGQIGRPIALTKTAVIPANVHKWLRATAESLGRLKDLTVEIEAATVQVPAEGFSAVVTHLVENALKFSLPGTPVRIKAAVVGKNFEIQVVDRGRGMADEDLGKIDALVQIKRDQFEQQGLGMGLALARNFARLAGGELLMSKNISGAGLTVRMILPLSGAFPGEKGAAS
jgi:two-component system sensor histidine kinase/response regulator